MRKNSKNKWVESKKVISYLNAFFKQWEQYMKCDGLPDPASPPAMHTYLHLWRSDPKSERSIEPVIKKTEEFLHVR
jgi:Cancer susceptibility candidate 1 N-terminus